MKNEIAALTPHLTIAVSTASIMPLRCSKRLSALVARLLSRQIVARWCSLLDTANAQL
jgi:hypothetical protein